jgi:hypothetical protein
MRKLIVSKKGAGLVTVGEWTFIDGQDPIRGEMIWHHWCDIDDPQYDDFVAHCKTLV